MSEVTPPLTRFYCMDLYFEVDRDLAQLMAVKSGDDVDYKTTVALMQAQFKRDTQAIMDRLQRQPPSTISPQP